MFEEKYFTFYSDPGHGWLAVDRLSLLASGVAHLISSYSYQLGETVYLEEDCDAGLFMGTLGYTPQFTEDYTDQESPIRHYSSFRLKTNESCRSPVPAVSGSY